MPRFYQVIPGVLRRRRATQALPVRLSSRRRSRESARRQPKDLPVASDVTAQTTNNSDSDRSLRRRHPAMASSLSLLAFCDTVVATVANG
jgi:hypothetical protein